jgi:hypothetical protein
MLKLAEGNRPRMPPDVYLDMITLAWAFWR